MKITDDFVKALQKAISSFGSITEVSKQSNVNIETLSRFLSLKTKSIRQETWDKIYPLLRPYLNTSKEPMEDDVHSEIVNKIPPRMHHDLASLSSDEKILLDAFGALPKAMQNQKLLEIVSLAQEELRKERED